MFFVSQNRSADLQPNCNHKYNDVIMETKWYNCGRQEKCAAFNGFNFSCVCKKNGKSAPQSKPSLRGHWKLLLDQHSYFKKPDVKGPKSTGKMWKETKEESRERGTRPPSVLSQRYSLLIDALLGDDADPKGVSGVNVSLGG